jgi:hypothetical protein
MAGSPIPARISRRREVRRRHPLAGVTIGPQHRWHTERSQTGTIARKMEIAAAAGRSVRHLINFCK